VVISQSWTVNGFRRRLGVAQAPPSGRAPADVSKCAVDNKNSEEAERDAARQLVLRIRAGDRAAEGLLVERYGRGLLSLLRRKTGDPVLAEDLWQDTLRIALEHLRKDEVHEPERLAAFLHGIASNLVITHFRRERRRATRPDLEDVNRAPDPGGGQFADLSREQVARCVRTLLDELGNSRDRDILLRYYLYDRDKEEICAELGLDHLHFNRVLFRAKDRFRTLLIRAERRRHLGLVPRRFISGSDVPGGARH